MDAPLNAVLRQMWRPPLWMAKNERPRLSVETAEHLVPVDGGERVRLESFRVSADGDMIRSTWRAASIVFDADPREFRGHPAGYVRAIAETIEYLSRLVFPRPLPRFRIRRDARRLTA